jgi:hypothetical protein
LIWVGVDTIEVGLRHRHFRRSLWGHADVFGRVVPTDFVGH